MVVIKTNPEIRIVRHLIPCPYPREDNHLYSSFLFFDSRTETNTDWARQIGGAGCGAGWVCVYVCVQDLKRVQIGVKKKG